MDPQHVGIPTTQASVSRGVSTSTQGQRYHRPDSKIAFIARLNSASGMAEQSQRSRPQALGVHHLKFAVSNLDVSIAWYERVLGARHIPMLDHVRADGTRFAAVCEMTDWGGLLLELRQNELQASRDRGWDPVTLSVRGKDDLVTWINWLDRWGTTHSPLLTGVRGWLLIFEDPDGRRIRMYTKEDHGGTEPLSSSEHWLKEP